MNYKKTIISIHAPKAKKPTTSSEFGYFLAGLIDADGHISQPGYVQIDFNVREISVAHYVKHCVGYGKVTIERVRQSGRYRCTHPAGLAKIANLIRHKLKHLSKIEQFNTRLVALLEKKTRDTIDPTVLTSHGLEDMNNHWCAGFIQGDGCLVVVLGYQKNKSLKPTMSVNISQKSPDLLRLIQKRFGGNVGYRKAQDVYYYVSNSFTNAAKFIQYLDKYQFVGTKLTEYWIWRKAYLLYQADAHLVDGGQLKFVKLQSNLRQLRARPQILSI